MNSKPEDKTEAARVTTGPTPKSKDSERYEVGFGKPPRYSQFKPGQSGNQKGRPKGVKKLATVFREALNAPVSLRAGDKIRTMPRRRAMIEVAITHALKGDMRALLTIFKLASSLGELHPEAGTQFTGGCFVLPMKPESPEEWMRIYGDAAKGSPIPQNIVDTVNKMTRRTE